MWLGYLHATPFPIPESDNKSNGPNMGGRTLEERAIMTNTRGGARPHPGGASLWTPPGFQVSYPLEARRSRTTASPIKS